MNEQMRKQSKCYNNLQVHMIHFSRSHHGLRYAAIPNLFGTRDWYMERHFSTDQGKGDCSGMIQVY